MISVGSAGREGEGRERQDRAVRFEARVVQCFLRDEDALEKEEVKLEKEATMAGQELARNWGPQT